MFVGEPDRWSMPQAYLAPITSPTPVCAARCGDRRHADGRQGPLTTRARRRPPQRREKRHRGHRLRGAEAGEPDGEPACEGVYPRRISRRVIGPGQGPPGIQRRCRLSTPTARRWQRSTGPSRLSPPRPGPTRRRDLPGRRSRARNRTRYSAGSAPRRCRTATGLPAARKRSRSWRRSQPPLCCAPGPAHLPSVPTVASRRRRIRRDEASRFANERPREVVEAMTRVPAGREQREARHEGGKMTVAVMSVAPGSAGCTSGSVEGRLQSGTPLATLPGRLSAPRADGGCPR